MTTHPHLDQAREWAAGDFDQAYIHTGPRAAAQVIASLPDEWIDADQLRDVIERWRSEPLTSETAPFMVEQLHTLLPDPTPRTLADMTPDERMACQWMQAEVRWVPGERGVITHLTDYHAKVMWHDGTTTLRDHKDLTPLPDLPRIVWPAEHHPTDTEDTPQPAQPRPEDVPAGELWLVEADGQQGAAERELPGAENPWWLMRGWRVSDKDITLVHRLVPEKEQ